MSGKIGCFFGYIIIELIDKNIAVCLNIDKSNIIKLPLNRTVYKRVKYFYTMNIIDMYNSFPVGSYRVS